MMNKKVNCTEKAKLDASAVSFRILVLLFWTQHTIFSFIVEIVERLPVVGYMSDLVMPIMFLFSIVFAMPWMVSYIRVKDVMLYFVFLSIVLLTIVIYPDTSKYIIKDIQRILIASVPIYFIGVSYSHELCKRDLYYASLIGVFVMFLYQFYALSNGRELSSDNMSAAYYTLPSVMYLIHWTFEHKKIHNYVAVVLGFVLMLAFGTRGPILALLIFLAISILISTFKSRSIFVKLFFLIVISFFVFVLSVESILLNLSKRLSELFEDAGFSVRIMDLFIEGEIAHSSGRDLLSEQILEKISQNPIIGYGFMGDRPILGFYVHNIILELWCSFGVILGSVFILLMTVIPLKASIKKHDKIISNFIIMLFCMVFVKLMFTSSYVVEPYLFLMLGISVNNLRRKDL